MPLRNGSLRCGICRQRDAVDGRRRLRTTCGKLKPIFGNVHRLHLFDGSPGQALYLAVPPIHAQRHLSELRQLTGLGSASVQTGLNRLPARSGISINDILKSYLGLLCLGKSQKGLQMLLTRKPLLPD